MQETFTNLIEKIGPVGSIVVASLLLILGLLVIFNPRLLAWFAGIALILVGVAIAAHIFFSFRIER